ncbi:transcription factor MYB35-like protein [Tanacetum coccineum]
MEDELGVLQFASNLGKFKEDDELESIGTCATGHNYMIQAPNAPFVDVQASEQKILRWPVITQQLLGRTDKDVKNYWNTKLKKKLSAMGIDPVTHSLFSQMLADYGNISGLTRTQTRMGSLSKRQHEYILYAKSRK